MVLSQSLVPQRTGIGVAVGPGVLVGWPGGVVGVADGTGVLVAVGPGVPVGVGVFVIIGVADGVMVGHIQFGELGQDLLRHFCAAPKLVHTSSFGPGSSLKHGVELLHKELHVDITGWVGVGEGVFVGGGGVLVAAGWVGVGVT